jgi:parallel beta-helix repeat protein
MAMDKKKFIAALTIVGILLSLVGVQFVEVAKAQSTGSIIINPDGSVVGTNNIQRNRDLYTLTSNISGSIQVQKSFVVIDGAGHCIEGIAQYGRGIDISNDVDNVTVKNLKIINCYYAIGNANTNNNTFIGNYIANCDTGFWIIGSANNTLTRNTVKDCVTGISINYAGFNIITENNIINNSLLVWLSTEPFVDSNYWSNYLTKYPNAKEIEKAGLPNLFWDTPYNYGESLGNYIDSHPLINPISTSPISTPTPTSTSSPLSTSTLSPSPSQTIEPSPSIPEFPAWLIVPVALAMVAAAIMVRRKRKP